MSTRCVSVNNYGCNSCCITLGYLFQSTMGKLCMGGRYCIGWAPDHILLLVLVRRKRERESMIKEKLIKDCSCSFWWKKWRIGWFWSRIGETSWTAYFQGTIDLLGLSWHEATWFLWHLVLCFYTKSIVWSCWYHLRQFLGAICHVFWCNILGKSLYQSVFTGNEWLDGSSVECIYLFIYSSPWLSFLPFPMIP